MDILEFIYGDACIRCPPQKRCCSFSYIVKLTTIQDVPCWILRISVCKNHQCACCYSGQWGISVHDNVYLSAQMPRSSRQCHLQWDQFSCSSILRRPQLVNPNFDSYIHILTVVIPSRSHTSPGTNYKSNNIHYHRNSNRYQHKSRSNIVFHNRD